MNNCIKPEQAIAVVAKPHPFSSKVERIELPQGLTLEQMLEAAQPDPVLRRHAVVFIDDWFIPSSKWHCVKPRAGRSVTIGVRPEGGDGGGKMALRIVLAIVVIAVAIYAPYALGAAYPALAAGTVGGTALSAGIALSGTLLINALVPLPGPKLKGLSDTRQTPTFGLAGGRNEARPYGIIPWGFGQHRYTPPLGASYYTEIAGGEQYLRMLVTWGLGPCELADLKIGETPLEQYEDVEVEHRISAADIDTPLTLYPGQVAEEQFDLQLFQDVWVERRTAPDTDEISLDILFPRGLIQIDDDGGRHPERVEIDIETREVGEIDWVQQVVKDYNAETISIMRKGVRITGLARGQYDVRLRRITDDPPDPGEESFTVLSESHWTALRSFTNDDPIALPGVARSALRIRATDQLNGVVDQLNGVAFWIIPDWDAQSGTWIVRPTRNPASCFRAVLQGPGNDEPAADGEIDLEQLQYWHGFCEAQGFTYDAMIDYEISPIELLFEICAAGRGSFSGVDGRWSVVVDEPRTVPVQHFTPRNSWGFEREHLYPDLPHAWRVGFINGAKGWYQDERFVYADGFDESTATRIADVEFPGVTDEELIRIHGRYRLAELELRPRTYKWFADLEHIVCTHGDLVRVAHDVPLWGTGWGRVRAPMVDGEARVIETLDETRVLEDLVEERVTEGEASGVSVDETVVMEAGKSYAARFRLSDGESLLVRLSTVPGASKALMFEGTVPAAQGPQAGDLWLLGELGEESVELLVRAIEPQTGDHAARLVGVDYAPAVFTAHEGEIPDFDSHITLPAGVFSPLIVGVRSDETVLFRDSSGLLKPRMVLALFNDGARPVVRIQEIVVRYRPTLSIDGPWTRVVAAADADEVSLEEVEEGRSYRIRVAYRFRDGTPSTFAETTHTVIGASAPPPDVEVVIVDRTTLVWSYPSPPADLAGFRVRLLPGTQLNWSLGVPAHGGILTVTTFDLSRVSPGDWTAMVKAVDVGGRESTGTGFVAFTRNAPLIANIVFEQDLDAAGFPGTIARGTVNMGVLEADGTTLFLPSAESDFLPDPDADFLPDEHEEMVWETEVEAPAEALAGDLVRIEHEIEGVWLIEYAPADELAAKGWREWPGAIDAGVIVGAVDDRLLLRVTTEGGPLRGRVINFDVLFDPPDVVELLKDVAIADTGTRLPIVRSYRQINAVAATIRGSGEATARLVDKDPDLGPLVELRDFTGALVAGNVDATVQGY